MRKASFSQRDQYELLCRSYSSTSGFPVYEYFACQLAELARAEILADGKVMASPSANSPHTGVELDSTRPVEFINSMAEPSSKSS